VSGVGEPFVQIGMVSQVAKRGQSGGSRKWIAGQSARLVNGTLWTDHPHQVTPASVGGRRRTPRDYLSKRGEVCIYPIFTLSTGRTHPETGHHLVENEKRSGLVA